MTSGMGEPTLKCVIAWSDARNLCGVIEQALEARVEEGDLRQLNEDSYLVYTPAATSDIREWIAAGLKDGESVLVVEFETWSGYGPPGLDSRWLMRRGH